MAFPSVELLNQTHRFPGDYTFKAIGELEGAFEAEVVAAVPQAKGRISKKTTSKHVSLTLEARVKSAEEVIQIYKTLSQLPGLILLL